jgi:uncharacterized damage-inducible protein DinB
MDDPRYPTGKPHRPTGPLDESQRATLIDTIAATPTALRKAVVGLDATQLDTPYRDGGWTVRQVVHHVPDSHLNAYIRFRLALTEDNPTIKPYNEAAWATLSDARTAPVEISLTMLAALHDRWVRLLRTMTDKEFWRPLMHPENGPMTLDGMLALYAWHGPHHTAHITKLRERKGW